MSASPQHVDSWVVDEWAGICSSLQQLTSSNSQADAIPFDARAEKVQKKIDSFDDDKATSVHTQAELVHGQKVPLQLFSACRDAAQLQLSPADKACALTAAFSALKNFVTLFVKVRGFVYYPGEDPSEKGAQCRAAVMRGLPAVHSRDWFSRLTDLMEVQLQQSQLLLHLPYILADAAAALRNHVSTPAQPLAAAGTAGAGAGAAAVEAAASRRQHKAPAVGAFIDLAVQAKALLDAHMLLLTALYSERLRFLKASASSTPAALELALSTFSSVSSMLQQTGKPGDSAGHSMRGALYGAWQLIHNYIEIESELEGGSKSHPELLLITKHPQYQQCILLSMALTAYGVLAKQHEVAAGHASSSGSSAAAAAAASSSSRKALKQQRVQSMTQVEWQMGLELQQHITQQQQHLIDALGVSSTTLMFAAASLRGLIDASDMETYIPCYAEAHLASWQGNEAVALVIEPPGWSGGGSRKKRRMMHHPRSPSSSSRTVARVLVEAQKHLSLASVLLHTAAALPKDSTVYLEARAHAADGAQLALDNWQQLIRSSHEALVTAAPAGAVQALQELLLDVLPAVLSMLTHTLQSLQGGVSTTTTSSRTDVPLRFQLTDTPLGTNTAERDHRTVAASLVAVLCKLLQDSLPRRPQAPATTALSFPTPPPAAPAAEAAGSAVQQTTAPSADASGLGTLNLAGLQAHGQLATVLRRLQGFVRVTAAVPAWLTPTSINKPQGGDRAAAAKTAWQELTKLLDERVCSFVQFVCSAGAGSAEARELQGLLVSLTKAAAACEAAAGCGTPTPAGVRALRLAAATAGDATGGAAAVMCSSPHSSSCSGAAFSAPAAAAGSAVNLLPSLVVAGRWCLRTAERLQAQPAASVAASIRTTLGKSAQWPLVQVPEACLAFLQRGDVSSQLAAAGYKPQHMQQAAQEFLQALQGVEVGSVNEEVAVSAMTQQLQALGRALTAVAIPHACNNPSCRNVRELREQKVVSGSGCTCGNCRVARYCSKECQVQHWQQHMPVCNAVKRAEKVRRAESADT